MLNSTKPRILVTGGAGYIGSHTVVDLVEDGYEPVLVDNFSNSERGVLDRLETLCAGRLRFHDVDCRDRAAIDRVFQAEGPIEGVIHFAASKAVSESQQKPLLYYGNNLGSLIALLEVMDAHRVRDLVFSSSCTVYGQPERLPVTEETAVAEAASVYGATKQIGEKLLRDLVAANASYRVVLLRYFNPIGAHPSTLIGEQPRGVPQNLMPIILQSAAGLRGPVQIYGDNWNTPDGTCIRDYIHVMDLAGAHVKSLAWLKMQAEDPCLEIFNVGTGQGTSVKTALDAFQRATGQMVASEIASRRAGDIEQIYASCEKAERMLNWKATRSVEDALRDAWAWQSRSLSS